MATLREILNRQAPPSREAIRQLIERSLERDVKLRLALDGPDDVIKRFSRISLAGVLKELERNHSNATSVLASVAYVYGQKSPG